METTGTEQPATYQRMSEAASIMAAGIVRAHRSGTDQAEKDCTFSERVLDLSSDSSVHSMETECKRREP